MGTSVPTRPCDRTSVRRFPTIKNGHFALDESWDEAAVALRGTTHRFTIAGRKADTGERMAIAAIRLLLRPSIGGLPWRLHTLLGFQSPARE